MHIIVCAMSELTTVAVRLLREFTAKAYELDLHFTLLPTAHQDMMPRSAATSRRDLHYQKKMLVWGAYRHLRVRGWADV